MAFDARQNFYDVLAEVRSLDRKFDPILLEEANKALLRMKQREGEDIEQWAGELDADPHLDFVIEIKN